MRFGIEHICPSVEGGATAFRLLFAVRKNKSALKDGDVFVGWMPVRRNYFSIRRLYSNHERESGLGWIAINDRDRGAHGRQIGRRLSLYGFRGRRHPLQGVQRCYLV